jgi:hypothetical protein
MITLRRAYSDQVSPSDVGRQALQRCATASERALAVRRHAPTHFVDVDYRALVAKPAATVAALYERLGRPPPRGLEGSVTSWLEQHPQHQHGVHRYTPETFGLTAAAVDAAFAPYLDRGHG